MLCYRVCQSRLHVSGAPSPLWKSVWGCEEWINSLRYFCEAKTLKTFSVLLQYFPGVNAYSQLFLRVISEQEVWLWDLIKRNDVKKRKEARTCALRCSCFFFLFFFFLNKLLAPHPASRIWPARRGLGAG